MKGLRLAPDAALADAPQLDALHVPGGFGQEGLMEDEEVLSWIRKQAADARSVFSACTGALICGAAELLKGRRVTTHWAAIELLPFFGAIPVNERVVMDGNWIFAAGVTAGIDGALRLAAELRGEAAAQPFHHGAPAVPYLRLGGGELPAIGMGRFHGSVPMLLEQRHAAAAANQIVGGGDAGNPAADHGDTAFG